MQQEENTQFDPALIHGVDAETATNNIQFMFGKIGLKMETDPEEAVLELRNWIYGYNALLEYKKVECVGNKKEAERLSQITEFIIGQVECLQLKYAEITAARKKAGN